MTSAGMRRPGHLEVARLADISARRSSPFRKPLAVNNKDDGQDSSSHAADRAAGGPSQGVVTLTATRRCEATRDAGEVATPDDRSHRRNARVHNGLPVWGTLIGLLDAGCPRLASYHPSPGAGWYEGLKRRARTYQGSRLRHALVRDLAMRFSHPNPICYSTRRARAIRWSAIRAYA